MGKPVRAPDSTFAERLAYARWARLLTSPEPEESDSDLAARAGMSQPWVSQWKGSETPPSGFKGVKGLARALGCSDDWLVSDAEGPAPLPALWRDWLAARRGRPVDATDPRYVADGVMSLEAVELLIATEVERAKAARATARGAATKAVGGVRDRDRPG